MDTTTRKPKDRSIPIVPTRPIDGILLLDKPLGISSNAALQRVKRLFGAKKAGHSGSLDPLATGMLPICMGKATKLTTGLLGARKCYRFTVRLGIRRSTGDLEGEPVEQGAVPHLDQVQIEAVLETFLGAQTQIPPMYSALKHEGKRLYELARQGIEIEREPRAIQLDVMQFNSWQSPDLCIDAVCSKGTYIRVLAEDIAKALGSCGHLIELRRLWVEPYLETQMVTLDTLESVPLETDRDRWLVQTPPSLQSAVVSPKVSE